MGETEDYTESVAAHKASHEDGGADEVNVDGLSGELADEQKSEWSKVSGKPTTFPPEAHGEEHEAGEADEIDVGGLSGQLADEQLSSWAGVSGKPTWFDGTPQSDDFSEVKEPKYWRHFLALTAIGANYWDRAENPGYLTMYAEKYTALGSGTLRTMFPYQVLTGDFTVETKIILDVSPGQNYRAAGLLLYRTTYNLIRFARLYNDAEQLHLMHIVDGTYFTSSISFTQNTLWLKHIRTNSTTTSWYSTNGTDWTQFTDPSTVLTTSAPLWVGPVVLTGTITPLNYSAKFEYINFT